MSDEFRHKFSTDAGRSTLTPSGDKVRLTLELRHKFSTDAGRSTLTPSGDKVRLTLELPNGDTFWVEWSGDQARAIRDGLSTWLDDQPDS